MLRISCSGSKQFCCPNYPPLGTPKDLDIELNPELMLDPPFLGNPPPPLEYSTEFSRKVAVMHVTPELHDTWYDVVYGENSTFDAVILDAYGLGNLPSNTKLTELIASRSATGLQTFVTTQCHYGNVSADYASSAERLGGILCADMTLPAIYCKVSIMIQKAGRSTQESRRLLGLSIHGEISPPDQGRLKLPGWIYRYFEGLLEPYLGSKWDQISGAVLYSVMLSAAASGGLPFITDVLHQDANLLEACAADRTTMAHLLGFQNSSDLLELLKNKISSQKLKGFLQKKDVFGIEPIGYGLRIKKKFKLEELSTLVGGDYEPDDTIKANVQTAVAASDAAFLELFLTCKPKNIHLLVDIENRNLLHIACFQGSSECVTLLTSKRYLAEATILFLLSSKDLDGCRPVDLAAVCKQEEIVKSLQKLTTKLVSKPATT